MSHPGEGIQIYVKYVPQKCMSKELKELEEKYYQYTAIDEYTRKGSRKILLQESVCKF